MSSAEPPDLGGGGRPSAARWWAVGVVAAIVLAGAAVSPILPAVIAGVPTSLVDRVAHTGRGAPAAQPGGQEPVAGRLPPATSLALGSRAAVRMLQPAQATAPGLALFVLLVGVFWRVVWRRSATEATPVGAARERGPPGDGVLPTRPVPAR
jgi:hypothetical protein